MNLRKRKRERPAWRELPTEGFKTILRRQDKKSYSIKVRYSAHASECYRRFVAGESAQKIALSLGLCLKHVQRLINEYEERLCAQ